MRRIALAATVRVQTMLAARNRDRGDIPAKAIIYAGMAVIAAAVLAWATPYVQGWLSTAPAATP